MDNVQMKVDNKNILTIKVDLNKDSGPSKSRKSIMIATTKGNRPVDQGREETIGLNIYRSFNDKDRKKYGQ